MLVDVNTFIGPYPFRHVPHPDAASLVGVAKREGIDRSLVGYLPAPWHRSTAEGNRVLLELTEAHDSLSPVPAINPSWPGWERELDETITSRVKSIRAYPPQWGLPASSPDMRLLANLCAERELPLILTAKFEDLRQRHWMDTAGDISAAAVRDLARAGDGVRIVLTCAGRSLIEEIHWSLTPRERERIWYDISWIWGPPENDLAHLLRTIGAERFLFGSMWPLRLVQTPFANLELLDDSAVLGSAATLFGMT